MRQPLPSRIWIGLPKGGFWQPLKYENLPDYCFECCSLVHRQSNCGKQIDLHPKPKQVWRVKSVPNSASSDAPSKASDGVAHLASTSAPLDSTLAYRWKLQLLRILGTHRCLLLLCCMVPNKSLRPLKFLLLLLLATRSLPTIILFRTFQNSTEQSYCTEVCNPA